MVVVAVEVGVQVGFDLVVVVQMRFVEGMACTRPWPILREITE